MTEASAFPYDLNGSHPIDNLPPNAVVLKTSPEGYRVTQGSGTTDGHQIAVGDPFQPLPVGATVTMGEPGPTRILLTLPETVERAEVHTFGTHFHHALFHAWAWLEREIP
jgi:hypothetical protein